MTSSDLKAGVTDGELKTSATASSTMDSWTISGHVVKSR